jgi:hypothetical protein
MQGFAGKFSTYAWKFGYRKAFPKFLEKFPSKRAATLQAPACRTFAKEK